MKPLAQLKLLLLTLIILKTSWGSQLDHRRTFHEKQQQRRRPTIEIENIKDLWYDLIRKSDKVYPRVNSLYRNQSDGQRAVDGAGDDDFNKLIDVLSDLRPSSNQSKLTLSDLRRAIIKNRRSGRSGRGIFRNYCGPGNDEAMSPNVLFPEVDSCCRDHDYCSDWISASTSVSEYQKKYPGLPSKHLWFSSLLCDCDVDFYNCLKTTNTWLGEVMLGIYAVAQTSCFKYDYKYEKCSKYDEWVN